MNFIKVTRGWQDSEVFQNEPYSEREAWLWMIGEANFKDRLINIDNKPYMLRRGQFRSSIRFMAEKFQWSKDRVMRFTEKLANWGMVATDTATGQTIITICNYSKYQDSKDGDKDTTTDSSATVAGHLPDTSKDKLEEGSKKDQEGKEEEEGARLPAPTAAPFSQMWFAQIWRAYPGRGKNGATGDGFKGNREEARTELIRILDQKREEHREELVGRIVKKCSEYQGYLDGSGSPGKHLCNWLKARGWEDEYGFAAGLNPQSGKPYSHTILDAAERAKRQLGDQVDRGFSAEDELAALERVGIITGGIPQAARAQGDDHRALETIGYSQAHGQK